MRPTSCILGFCPSWLLKAATADLTEWLQPWINSSLSSAIAIVSVLLKEAVIQPLLTKTTLVLRDMGNYRPVFNLSFLGMMFKCAVALQLQRYLDNII